jgi:alpha/beta superfamily hydrolase
MSMSVSAATASAWNSYAAWSRLQSASCKLSSDLSPEPASNAVLTADRAAVVNAAHEVARIEARRAADVAQLKASHHTFDLLV